jgi:hypothetical protein
MSTMTSARIAFENLFTQERVTACDRILSREAQRLIRSTGANGNLFPILSRLASFKNGRPIECGLESERPQDIALVFGLELIRLNSRRMFTLNVEVDRADETAGSLTGKSRRNSG